MGSKRTLEGLLDITDHLVTSAKRRVDELQECLGELILELEGAIELDEDESQHPQDSGDDVLSQRKALLKRSARVLLAKLRLYREVVDVYCENTRDPRRAGAVGDILLKSRAEDVLRFAIISRTVLNEGALGDADSALIREEENGRDDGGARSIVKCTTHEGRGCIVDVRDNLMVGSGGFSQVFLVDWRGRDGAAKTMKRHEDFERMRYEHNHRCFEAEIDHLRSMRGADHIVQLYGHCDVERVLVMEFMVNGSLFIWLTRSREKGQEEVDPALRRRMGQGIAHGMALLHGKGIIHKDLKTENVLLDAKFSPKVSDFGLSRSLDADCTGSLQHGTWRALAPESIRTGKSEERGQPADVYAYAILLWEMGTLELAWSGRDSGFICKEVLSSKKRRPALPPGATVLERGLMEQCWNHEPSKRPSFEEILAAWKSEGSTAATRGGTVQEAQQNRPWRFWGCRKAGEQKPGLEAAPLGRGPAVEEGSRCGRVASLVDTPTKRTALSDLEAEIVIDRAQAQVAAKDRELSEAEIEHRKTKEALAAEKKARQEAEEKVRATSRAQVPGAPRIRDWYVEREAVITKACCHLGIPSRGKSRDKPRMVGLAGPGGAGKSTVAAMVVARTGVQAVFHKGVLWLTVGRGAKNRLPALMLRLANMVYETVLDKTCRPLRNSNDLGNAEDGAAYIREVVGENCRRYLVVADDVWDAEVLEELRRVGAWVLYTTRANNLISEAPLRLDRVRQEEAETVLRRAADLDNNVSLPDSARELVYKCECVVMDLAFVGRWGVVRGRADGNAWRTVLQRISDAQKGGEGGELLPWRTAVLRAGLEELAVDNRLNRDLYISLAVMPKRFTFSSEDAAALLYDEDLSTDILKVVGTVLATLERWSTITQVDGGKYRVHDAHAKFLLERIGMHPVTRDTALRRWRDHVSSVRALLRWSCEELADIWSVLPALDGRGGVARAYGVLLEGIDSSDIIASTVLYSTGNLFWITGELVEASKVFARVLDIEERKVGADQSYVAHIVAKLGLCTQHAGRREEAEGLYRRALAIWENLRGDHPDMVLTLSLLGECAQKARRKAEAEALYKQALVIEEKQGADHTDVHMAYILAKLGLCASEAGRREEAEGLYRRALAIEEAILGADDPDVARTLVSIGECAREAGRMEEAEGLYRRALAIEEEKLGGDHLRVATTLVCLGVCASEAGRTEEAEGFYRRALAIQEEKLGADHLHVASSLTKLGECAEKAGQWEEAEGLYRRALAMEEEKLGADHPDLDFALVSLGTCAWEIGRRGEAEGLFRRALSIEEDKWGADHPQLAYTLQHLGKCAWGGGRTVEAEGLYRRALAMDEDKLGANHLNVASTLVCLGVCAQGAGRSEEAEGLYRRAHAIREEKQGGDHPDVASTLVHLGSCAYEAGQSVEAEGLYRRALVIQEKLGGDHPNVAPTLVNLGVCAWKAGRRVEAEELYRRAHAIQEKLGADHPNVASTLVRLGSCAQEAGRSEEAERLYRQALALDEEKLGSDHPNVASALLRLGACAWKAGREVEVEEMYRRALAIQEEKLGSDHLDVAYTLVLLGLCAQTAGRRDQAEGLYRQALAIHDEKLGADNPKMASVLVCLGMCAWEAGRRMEAEGLYRRALAIQKEKLGADHPKVAYTVAKLWECDAEAGRAEDAEGLY